MQNRWLISMVEAEPAIALQPAQEEMVIVALQQAEFLMPRDVHSYVVGLAASPKRPVLQQS